MVCLPKVWTYLLQSRTWGLCSTRLRATMLCAFWQILYILLTFIEKMSLKMLPFQLLLWVITLHLDLLFHLKALSWLLHWLIKVSLSWIRFNGNIFIKFIPSGQFLHWYLDIIHHHSLFQASVLCKFVILPSFVTSPTEALSGEEFLIITFSKLSNIKLYFL